MNFKNLSKAGIIAMAALMIACKGENKPVQVKSNGAVPAQNAKGLALAYVDIDSLQNNYQFFIDAKKELESKGQKYDSEMNRLGANLQKAAASFQKKAQSGQFTSQAQFDNAQKALANQQNQLEQKQAKYAQELANDQMNFQEALQDSLNNFIADFNKDQKYSMILTKAGNNILYADKAMDITADVIAGLNKRYKKK